MDNADAVRFTLLGGGTPLDEDELNRLYSYPAELTRCVVRGNVIASLDGAATTDGTSGRLGGVGDRWLFAVQRELADVIVVGAGTTRTENYGGARLTVAQRTALRSRLALLLGRRRYRYANDPVDMED